MNTTTISLLKTGDCDIQQKNLNSTDTYIQLLQAAEFNHVNYIQCSINVVRTVYYCGMHSHVAIVNNGHAEYLKEITFDQCRQMHTTGTLSLANGKIIDNLKVNSTTSRSITFAGFAGNNGKCTGTTYSDIYGTWDNAVVQGVLKITLRSGTAPVKISSGKITLNSGTSCNLADTTCLDLDDGYTFWNAVPPAPACNFDAYDVLYEGSAKRTKELNEPNSPEIYSLITQEITFALTKTTEVKLCGYSLFRTEHPKLFILETTPGNTFMSQKQIAVGNLDIFTYVNSKFVYVEKHIRTQITTLYNDILQQKCELEKQVIVNALSIASNEPTEFAHNIMKKPGYTAVPAGEAIHLIKCIPIEVQMRPTQECFNELPVFFKNESYFLMPKSHILKKIGTQRECNSVFPVQYNTEHGWIRLLPRALDVAAPNELQPRTRITWNYLTPGKLATSGIYSQSDIDKLREHMMFPAEKPSITNNIVRGFTGKQPLGDGISLYNALDEDTLEKLARSASERIWSGFMNFGSISAGVLGIFIIIRLIKLIFDTLIHGYALHTVYGCGLQLLGALWSSITHLLLHLAKTRPPSQKEEDQTETNETTDPSPQPLKVIIDSPPKPVESDPCYSATYLELSQKLRKT